MNYTESERKPNRNYVPPAGYVEVTKECLDRQYKIDPLYKLFESTDFVNSSSRNPRPFKTPMSSL